MSYYKLEDRYQFQRFHVRMYRRVRHGLPLIPTMIQVYAAWVFVHRLSIPEYPPGYYRSRFHVLAHSLKLLKTTWEMNCGMYATMDEVLGKNKCVHTEPTP